MKTLAFVFRSVNILSRSSLLTQAEDFGRPMTFKSLSDNNAVTIESLTKRLRY